MEKLVPCKFATCLMLCFIVCSEAFVPRMILGRPKGGFLGAPGNKHHRGNLKATDQDQWFKQKLDHFNETDTRYWQQRYFTSDANYKEGGPLFIMIGGEGEASPLWLTGGAWIDYAQRYNAYCVILEHRFYGQSRPTADTSVENLQYLSSEQALADLAAFITDFNKQQKFPKVITIGGSYSGSLSAWFRLKYPNLVNGAVASSAPLLAVVNFSAYLEVVDQSLRTVTSGACNDAISAATAQIGTDLTTQEGRQKLKTLFKLCEDIDPNIKNDISLLYVALAANIEFIVQYNRANMAFEGGLDLSIRATIDDVCDIMTDTSLGDPLQRYAKVNALQMQSYGQNCLDFKYDHMIASYKLTDWESSVGGRPWFYQTCTEFGFYQSSDATDQPFGHGFPIGFWTQQCADVFGASFNKDFIEAAVSRTNQFYGALGLRITRVIFPNGSIDPWHALGVLKDLNPDARAIFITGTSHCADMVPPTPEDPPQLVRARQEISDVIGQWLQS